MLPEEGKSGLFLYSLGIVVESKKFSVDEIYVTPIEHLNIENVKMIKDSNSEFKNELPDKDGKISSSSARSSTTLIAKWIPFGHSNRTTAPDVVKNETVILFKYADVDEYFWTTIFREPSLRRLERVLYSYSNLPSAIKEYTKESSYWTLVSTKDKMIHLHTSINDGEHCGYDITCDTKQGIYKAIDTKGNFVEFNSRANDLNTSFKKDINSAASRDINSSAGRDINRTAGKDITRRAAGNITDSAGGAITMNAQSITLNAPSIVLNGNVTITGTLTVNNSASFPSITTGDATIGGVKQVGD